VAVRKGLQKSKVLAAEMPEPYIVIPDEKTVVTIQLTSNVATITTKEVHGFEVGQIIFVGDINSTLNGEYLITNVTEKNISFNKTASNIAPTNTTSGVVSQRSINPIQVTHYERLNNFVKITTTSNHNFANRNKIFLQGVSQNLDGMFEISRVTDDTFSYFLAGSNISKTTISGAWASQKSIQQREDEIRVTAVELTSNVATITTSVPHYYTVGTSVWIQGVNSVFNGEYVVNSVNANNPKIFTFNKIIANVASTPVTTGSVVRKSHLVFYTRYRAVSEDRNQTSHWSPIYSTLAPYWFRKPSNGGVRISEFNTTGIGKTINISWDPVDLMIENNFTRRAIYYDVWLKWHHNNDSILGNNGDWVYEQRVQGTSHQVNIPISYQYTDRITDAVTTRAVAPNRLSIEIRMVGNPITRTNTRLLLAYELLNATV
jgi:hypothetical protein